MTAWRRAWPRSVLGRDSRTGRGFFVQSTQPQ
uniref:Uncharacterized protein n=1 Tax=Myoviridae sp. ctCpP1 TaxID=2825054 RepID=A0A8S5V7X4_9CAUD|nr:MAG TPA: hypothetical protein [Myoviridae sp. ctCpP1]